MDRSTLSQIILPVIILVLFVIGIYSVVKLRSNFTPAPTIDINVEDNTATNLDKLEISGTTSAKELTIDGNEVSVAEDGTFSYQLPLNPGENKISLTATVSGKTTTIERTVTRTVAVAKAPKPNKDLSSSGPAENIGIIGLAGVIFAAYYYYRSRARSKKLSYKLFTKSNF